MDSIRKRRNTGRQGGGLARKDAQRLRDTMEKLRGRPFQMRDFVRIASGLQRHQPGYHKIEMRFYAVVRSGAIAVLKVGDTERERLKYRFYKVVDPSKWEPRLLKDHSRRERRVLLNTLIGHNHQPVALPTNADTTLGELIDRAVQEALEKTGVTRRRNGAGEYTFCLVRAADVASADAVAVLERMAEDKMHTWGRAENELLRDHLVLSSSNPLPSIPKWKDLGIEILGTVKARGKREAEMELLALVTAPTS